MKHAIVAAFLFLGLYFPQQGQEKPPCDPAQDMHEQMAQHHHMAPEAPPQSPEARHHAFLDEERQAIERGEGFGMAFAAEMNGYPGPRHILDLQNELKLTPDQAAAVQKLFDEMKQQALARGKEVLQAEGELERMFRANRPEAELHEQALRVASLRGELRWAHLRAHLAAAGLLTKEQNATYSELRHSDHHTAGAP
jgi:Spy/CpxP family protein refolding chaperone